MTVYYEYLTSYDQDLSFERISDRFPHMMDDVRVRNEEGLYNNLALLLSDQCPWGFTVVSSHYGQVHRTAGPIMNQVDDVLDVLDCMNPRMYIKGRTGLCRRFPRKGLEEGVVNAVIHCDLSLGRDVTVLVDPDVLSIISPGGVWKGGLLGSGSGTRPRNRNLGNLMLERGRAGLRGHGMHAMREPYTGTGLMPTVVRDERWFVVNYPALTRDYRDFESRRRQVLTFVRTFRGSDERRISASLMMTPYYTRKILSRMEDEGDLFSMGIGMNRMYFPNRWRRRNDESEV